MPSAQTRSDAGCGSPAVACSECSLHHLCLPVGIDRTDLEHLDSIVRRRAPRRRGEHLFQHGDPFRTVYVIRSGSVKTFTCSRDGVEHVTGFYLPGEILGLEAIAQGHHGCAARALETTSVCEIAYDDLEGLAVKIRGLQRQLLRLMSCEIVLDQHMMVLLGSMPADQRLASLLVSLSERLGRRGFSRSEFRLSLSRNDIASYLGLAVETVSRLFSRLQAEGLLAVERRHVRILDPARLYRLADLRPPLFAEAGIRA